MTATLGSVAIVSKFFPHQDPHSGELVPVEYFDTAEVARLLGVSRDVVRRRCARHEWPHLREQGTGRYYMNADDVAAVTAAMRHAAVTPDEYHAPRLAAAWGDDVEGIR